MSKLCTKFNYALQEALQTTELAEMFNINGNTVKVSNNEALKSLVIDIFSKTNQLITEDIKTVAYEDILESLKDEGIENVEMEAIINIFKEIEKSYVNLYFLHKVETKAGVRNEFPRLKDTLTDYFLGENTLKMYRNWFNSKLIEGVVYSNTNRSRVVRSSKDLNFAIMSFKNNLLNKIALHLNMPPVDMYMDTGAKGYKLNLYDYNVLIQKAIAKFSSRIINGKYKSTGIKVEDEAYFSLFSLLNFDALIQNNNFNDIISVSNNGLYFFRSNNIPMYDSPKYAFTFSQTLSQRWDEDLSKDSDGTNPLVRKFLENLLVVTKKTNKEGKSYYVESVVGEVMPYKNFKEVLRILSKHPITKSYYSQIRHNPYSVTQMFKEAEKHRDTIFTGNDIVARKYFDTMYYRLFSEDHASLYNASESTFGVDNNFDIYGMILNQINKMSSTIFTDYIYELKQTEDTEIVNNSYKILTAADFKKQKYIVEKNIMANSMYTKRRDFIFDKWNVSFLSDTGESINFYKDENTKTHQNLKSINLNIDNNIFTIDLSNKSKPKYNFNGVDISTSLNLTDGEFKNVFANLLKDFAFVYSDESFMYILENITTTNSDLTSILDVVTAAILNGNITENLSKDPSLITLLSNYPGMNTDDKQQSWKYINIETKTLKISGFFSATRGLELLATTQSILNGDMSKSSVEDALKNKLSIERLTNITNDDYNLFANNQRTIREELTEDNPFKYNIFNNFGLQTNQELSVRTELKTYFSSFYNTDPTKIASATEFETNYIAFVYDFLTRDGEISVQPTVYSDKSTIWNKVISTNTPLTFTWLPDHLKNRTLQELTPEEVREVKFISNKRMAESYIKKLNSDYIQLLNTPTARKLNLNYVPSKDELVNFKRLTTIIRENFNPEVVEQMLHDIKDLTGVMPTIINEIHWISNYNVNPSLFNFFNTYINVNTVQEAEIFNREENYTKILYANRLGTDNIIELSYSNGKNIKEISDSIDRHLELMGYSEDDIINYKNNWIDSDTNTLILYKTNGSKVFNASEIFNSDLKVELNPLLDKFLSLDNLISTNYNEVVYGLPFMHPAKASTAKSDAVIKIEKKITPEFNDYFNFSNKSLFYELAERTNASYKRAVIGGATINTNLKNSKYGIPGKIKLSVIADPIDFTGNIHGEIGKVDMYDGAVWMNPFYAVWEKNSISELKQSDIHRKPIGYFSLTKYLSSGLMKCATFSVNNAMIRNSLGKNNAKNMLKKMSDEPWIVPIELNINNLVTISKPISTSVTSKNNTPEINYPKYKKLIIDENGIQHVKIYTIKNIKFINHNVEHGKIKSYYNIIVVDNKGITSTIENVNINSNYTLWEVLGGEYSIDRNDNYDESSINLIANLASTDLTLDKNKSIEALNALMVSNPVYSEKFSNYIKIINNTGKYFQPLKISDVSYLANQSAIKNGAVNLQSVSNYYNDSDLLYTEIEPDFVGSQMSAEHHSENAEVSEMTQVISALIQKGISYDLTKQIYNDIGLYIADGLKPFMNTNNKELIQTLGKMLIKSFATTDLSDEHLAARYINLIKNDLMEKNVEKELLIPFDDPNIFSKFVIDFANNLNQNIIRRTFSGVNSVLNPSHDIIGLIETTDSYGNSILYTKEEYNQLSGVNSIENLPNTTVDPGEVVFGDWILDDGVEKQINYKPGKDSITLQEVRTKYRNTKKGVIKINKYGRNLRNHNYTFNVENRGKYDGFDLDSSKLSYNIKSLLDSIQSIDDLDMNNLDSLRLLKLFNFIASEKSLYTGTLDNFKGNINKYLQGDKKALKDIQLVIKEWIQYDVKRIQDTKQFPDLVEWSMTPDLNYSNIIGNIQYSANEMLLPKLWKTKFLLNDGDNLGKILTDPYNFFYNKLLELQDYENMYDEAPDGAFMSMELQNTNLYLTIDKIPKGFKEIKSDLVLVNNTKYVVDDDGVPLFPTRKGITYYENNGIILAKITNPKDISFISRSPKILSNVIFRIPDYQVEDVSILSTIKSDKKTPKKIKKYLNESNIHEDHLKALYIESNVSIQDRAEKMAESFKVALNYIVARIPAQSMQSFMNMTIKGFIATDSNVVYVPTAQLWLQGSDYDIDKAFILGASIADDGIFVGWSPYFNYTNTELFKLSSQLPLPTEKSVVINKEGFDITEIYENYLSKSDAKLDAIEAFTNFREDNPDITNSEIYFNLKEAVKQSEREELEALIVLLNVTNQHKSLNVTNDLKDSLIYDLNLHNLYFVEDIHTKQEAIKNKIFMEMWEIGSNYSNIISQTSPISISDGQEAAKNAESFSKYITNNNPAAKAIAQFQNSIGKQGIGIAATGIKVYSNTLTYAHSKLYAQKNWTKDEWISVIKDISGKPLLDINGLVLKGGFTNIIPNINYDNLANSFLINDNGEFIDNEGNITETPMSVLDVVIDKVSLRQILETVGAQDDVLLSISVLLSLATDNAKELVLEKINATPDLMGMYIYLLFRGGTFADVAKYMTSPIMSLLKDKAKRNIFNSGFANNNIESALNYYLQGVNLSNYIPENYEVGLKNLWFNFIKDKVSDPKILKNLKDLSKASIHPEMFKYISEFKQYVKDNKIYKNAIANIGINYISMEDMEEELTLRLEIEEEISSEGGLRSAKDNIKILINRYLNDVENRFLTLNSLPMFEDLKMAERHDAIRQEFLNVKRIRKGASELTLLGRLSSLNQGIKTQLFEQINFTRGIINEVNKYLNLTYQEKAAFKKLKNNVSLNEEETLVIDNLKKAFSSLEMFNLYLQNAYEPFDIDLFINDAKMQQMYKEIYKYRSEFLNVLDIILSVPHFKNMLETFSVNNNTSDRLTWRKSEILNLIDYTFNNDIFKGAVTNAHIRIINRFLSDVIINKFLNNLGTINLGNIKEIYSEGKIVDNKENITQLDLSNMDDRATFKLWIENYLANEFASKNNAFAKNLTTKINLNDLKVPYSSTVLNVDMSTLSKDVNESRLSEIEIDYAKHYSNLSIPGSDLSFSDLLAIYNLMINKGMNNSQAFTNLFKSDLTNPNSIMSKYMIFLSNLSSGRETVDYDKRDLLLRTMPLDVNINGITKKLDFNGNIEYFYDGTKLEFSDNPITNVNTLRFTTNTIKVFTKSQQVNLINKLIQAIHNGNAELKLKCD